MIRWQRVALLLALWLLPACTQGQELGKPPVMAIGADICDECGMIISEERFAAAYWTEEGEARRFDDVGGMVAYPLKHMEPVASFWVHDYLTNDWLNVDQATFVVNAGVMTPMGFGVLAVKQQDEAASLAFGQDKAKLFTWQELLDWTAGPTSAIDDHAHDRDMASR